MARVVVPGLPHQLTQRGNRREDVFFGDADRQRYLQLLIEYSDKHGLVTLAYCLMTNHVHFVSVPARADSLARVFKPVDLRYAQHINWTQGISGRLWQGRFFSCPLDDEHLWAAIRYVERNPVRARLVRKPEDYPWSRAQAHCGMRGDPILWDRCRNGDGRRPRTGLRGWRQEMMRRCSQGSDFARVLEGRQAASSFSQGSNPSWAAGCSQSRSAAQGRSDQNRVASPIVPYCSHPGDQADGRQHHLRLLPDLRLPGQPSDNAPR